jgi:hypothetical protein
LYVQLDRELEANKAEKHHKDTFRRFFISLGFENLERIAEQKVGGATLLNAALALKFGRGAVEGMNDSQDGDPIVWPDLYDINID